MLTSDEDKELERDLAEEIRRTRRYWRAMRDTEDAAWLTSHGFHEVTDEDYGTIEWQTASRSGFFLGVEPSADGRRWTCGINIGGDRLTAACARSAAMAVDKTRSDFDKYVNKTRERLFRGHTDNDEKKHD